MGRRVDRCILAVAAVAAALLIAPAAHAATTSRAYRVTLSATQTHTWTVLPAAGRCAPTGSGTESISLSIVPAVRVVASYTSGRGYSIALPSGRPIPVRVLMTRTLGTGAGTACPPMRSRQCGIVTGTASVRFTSVRRNSRVLRMHVSGVRGPAYGLERRFPNCPGPSGVGAAFGPAQWARALSPAISEARFFTLNRRLPGRGTARGIARRSRGSSLAVSSRLGWELDLTAAGRLVRRP